MATSSTEARINLEEPRYDQSTFAGRAKHFLVITNPLNLFCSGKELEEAKELVQLYRSGSGNYNKSICYIYILI